MSEWQRVQINELGDVITGKTPSSQFPDEFGSTMPFVTPSDFGSFNKWIEDSERKLSDTGIQKLKNKILPSESVLVTCIGSDMGKIALNKIPVITNQQINAILPFRNIVYPEFLYYKLIDSYEMLRMYGQAGTAVPIVNKGTFENIELVIPTDLREQKSIAEILASLDDKIDLVQRQNKTLEKIAETLWRQWFVEETDNKNSTALERWIHFDPKEKLDRKQQYQMFEMKCLSNDSMSIAPGVIRDVNSATMFRNGDTLLAKITPCLENGKTGFVMCLEEKEIARGSTEFIVMRSKGEVSPYWIYCLARDKDFHDTAVLSMTGTSGRQRVQVDILKQYEVKIDEVKMAAFHGLVEPLFEKIKSSDKQIITLTTMRDTLLPKLMSGELKVKQQPHAHFQN